jgi:hypothetical protein
MDQQHTSQMWHYRRASTVCVSDICSWCSLSLPLGSFTTKIVKQIFGCYQKGTNTRHSDYLTAWKNNSKKWVQSAPRWACIGYRTWRACLIIEPEAAVASGQANKLQRKCHLFIYIVENSRILIDDSGRNRNLQHRCAAFPFPSLWRGPGMVSEAARCCLQRRRAVQGR